MSLETDNDYVELSRSPVILLPKDQNCTTPSDRPFTPSEKSEKSISRDSSPRKDERIRGRARERLDFGNVEPRKSRAIQREENERAVEDKENFAVPKSPGPKQQPKTPAPRTLALQTPGQKVVGTPKQKAVGTQQNNTRGKSPVVKKHLQQLASLDDSGRSLSVLSGLYYSEARMQQPDMCGEYMGG